jgi:hypothetical protein
VACSSLIVLSSWQGHRWLDAAAQQWAAMSVGDRQVFHWPAMTGVVEHA